MKHSNIKIIKKIILTALIAMSFTFTYGQGKWQEKQNNYFVKEAVKEYNLSSNQKEELKATRMEMVKAYLDSNQRLKNGAITKEEMQEQNREASRKFNSNFTKLTGKSYKEIEPFLARMREELKKLK